tara:strand:+ start:4149 stop:4925 length:777 start_codon:yes stop_codon:yes gene_type:complete
MEIRPIGVDDIDIQIYAPSWATTNPPTAIPIYPPVTSQVGTPIVNIPGCVEAHKESRKNTTLKDEDPDGVMTLCDAGTPSYYPIDYDRNKLEYTNNQEAPKPPPIKPPEAPEPKAPAAPQVPKSTTPKPECPTRAQQLKNPIGKILEGNKKITGYEMVGKECLMVTEKLNIPDQIIQNIPSPGMATATVAVAVTATTSALLAKPLADLLLKAVKPTVKKVMKKIAALRGKKTQVESVKDRRDQQRIRSHAIRKLKGKE